MSNCDYTFCNEAAAKRFITTIVDSDGSGTEDLTLCRSHARDMIVTSRRNPAMSYDRMLSV